MKPLALEENFNKKALSVICLVGLVRVIIEMFRNTSLSGTLDFYLDLGYGVVFILTLIALFNKSSYHIIYLTFYAPLIILLCLTLFDRKGLASSTENNIYAGLIIIALTMRSSDAIKFSILLIIGTIISLISVEMKYNFLSDYSNYSTSNFNYIFMGIGVVIITFYSKKVFENRKEKLSHLKEELLKNHSILKASKSELEAKTTELERLNEELEEKVKERMLQLNNRKEAMKDYLGLTLQEFEKEYSGIHELAKESICSSNEQLSDMMLASSQKLDLEISALISKLKTESEEIN